MSARARHRRRARSRGSVRKKLLLVVAGVFGVILLAAGAGAAWVLNIYDNAPSIDTLKAADSGELTHVYDADGNSLGFVQSDILREPVDLDKIPKTLQEGTIAIEDAQFYEHGGVDYSAIVRAAVEDLEAGEAKQGASTITQQLVRNLYIKDPQDTIKRKIREAAMAQEYEDRYSKDEILNQYLNTASYGTNDGRTAVGVQAAAEVFFNKDVEDLGLDEAAMLAGLPQAPTDYNPFLNPKGAIERRNEVLDAMAEQGYITQAKANQVKQQGPGLERGSRYEQRDEPFFFDYVQEELIDKYGLKTVRAGGLKVYTTLDPDLQAAAQSAIAAHPTALASNALVSTDTHTGDILAMASSSSYDTSQFNLASQGGRQPGSSFKTFVLAEAIEEGYDPDSTYYPAPTVATLTPPGTTEPWSVAGDVTASALNIRDATSASVNTVYAELGIDVGPENFDDMAHRLGITSELGNYYAEAIGGTTTCCTVLEMSNAYATIANGGVHHDPTAIRKVEFPDGEVDKPENPEGKRVISDGVAYEVADVLKGPLDDPSGTAYGYGIGCPAAGKTGTAEDQVDAWFVGFTPNISTAVWTGNADSRVPLPGYGADLSAPIWHDYMEVAASEPCDDFPQPEDPVSLSAHTGGETAGSSSSSTTDDSYSTDSTTTTPPVDSDGDGFPDDAYAPGADQEPSPTPGNSPAVPPGQDKK